MKDFILYSTNPFESVEAKIRKHLKGLACPVHGKARKSISFDYDINEDVSEIHVSGHCCDKFAEVIAQELEPFGLPVVFKNNAHLRTTVMD